MNSSVYCYYDVFNHSGLFAGHPNNVVPLHNVQAVESSKFYLVGKIIAMTLVQGGEAPACFSKAIADYLVNKCISSPVDVSDIPDYAIRSSLECCKSVCKTLASVYDDTVPAIF